MPSAGAFFDLDRTLISGGSGPVFARALRRTGVVADRDNPLVDALFGLFRAVGESFITMQVTKRAVSATRGWSIEAVEEAARLAVDELEDQIQPFARLLIEQHRAAGRPVAIATTTPEVLVRPLGERLGVDAVIATRYGREGEVFNGKIDGPFVWNRGKLAAVRTWAGENGVSVAASYAYSDSFFDAPLLDAVSHPVAVNPDARLFGLAQLKRWPIRHLDKPEGVGKIAGMELQELIRPFVNPALLPTCDIEFSGLEHIPASGGAILCGNHRSYFDPFVIAMALAKRNRNARFLGKKELFDAPLVGALVRALGGIRVDRGSGSDEPLDDAVTALHAGDMVAIMPQGTIPRGPAFFDPVLQGRWGAARLAGNSGVPVIPMGLWGTEAVWPRSSRLPIPDPRVRPLVTACIGEPIELDGDDVQADTERLMQAISDLLPSVARVPHVPTDEELARTYPAGYDGNPEAESKRRPGED